MRRISQRSARRAIADGWRRVDAHRTLRRASQAMVAAGAIYLIAAGVRHLLRDADVQGASLVRKLLLDVPWFLAMIVVPTLWCLGAVAMLLSDTRQISRLGPAMVALAVGALSLTAGPDSSLAWVALASGLAANKLCDRHA